MAATFDFLVIGGGMAGVSAAYELARDGRVCLLEREEHLAFHSTGRSAAMLLETYGNGPVRALTRASRGFYAAPPDGFAPEPLMSPRGALFLADEARLPALRDHFEAVRPLVSVEWMQGAALSRLVPCLVPDRWVAGLFEPGGADLDVHAIHQGYARGVKAAGGAIVTGAEVLALSRPETCWTVSTPAGELSAPVLVNAAGAWADEVGRRAGARPIGLQPLKRTAILVDVQADVSSWPLVYTTDDELYFKPEAHRLLVSPSDETPVAPCNAAADDLDVAVAVDRLERATTLRVRHVSHRWAGLRSFVLPDRTPVVGLDPEVQGLVWLAAQGGYGIQTAPALARCCRAAAVGEEMPPDLAALGLRPEELSPRRLSGNRLR